MLKSYHIPNFISIRIVSAQILHYNLEQAEHFYLNPQTFPLAILIQTKPSHWSVPEERIYFAQNSNKKPLKVPLGHLL